MTEFHRHATAQNREQTTLTPSERHELLATARCRIAIGELIERSAPVDIDDLATAVAEREDGLTAPSEDTVKRVRLALHHNHLPRMAAVGLIDYDREQSCITEIRGESPRLYSSC